MSDDIYVRPLDQRDLEVFRAVRLKALKDHPELYGATYQDSIQQGAEYWLDILSRQDKEVFGVFDGDVLVGIGGVYVPSDDPVRAEARFVMGYIDPGYRGRGLSHLLFDARMGWSRARPYLKRLCIQHREGNEFIRRVILAHGFTFVRREERDGALAADMVYEKRL